MTSAAILQSCSLIYILLNRADIHRVLAHLALCQVAARSWAGKVLIVCYMLGFGRRGQFARLLTAGYQLHIQTLLLQGFLYSFPQIIATLVTTSYIRPSKQTYNSNN